MSSKVMTKSSFWKKFKFFAVFDGWPVPICYVRAKNFLMNSLFWLYLREN